jgi:hypothetical protein
MLCCPPRAPASANTMDESYHHFINHFLASNKAEALEWLRAASDQSFRNLGEMETDESIRLVQRLYDLGAQKVLAVEIDDYPEGANTGHLLVQLPPDDSAREQLFAFEREDAESHGFDGTPDNGQEYLYLKLD